MLQIFGFVVVALVGVHAAPVKYVDGKDSNTFNIYKDTDLSYSDLDSMFQEPKERLYQNFRDYGVPSDVAHMYVPHGMTVGDLFGKQKDPEPTNTASDEDTEEIVVATFDPWSVVWYIGSFGGLIAFFLVVSCSEWCCLRNRAAQQLQTRRTPAPRAALGSHAQRAQAAAASTETPPPAYHFFAPPPYDSITYGEKTEKYDVFVVPVHAVSPNFIPTATVQVHSTTEADAPPPEYASVAVSPRT